MWTRVSCGSAFWCGAFSGDSQTACVTDCVVHRPGMTASSISPKLAEDIFLRMGHFRQLLIDLAGVRLVRCVHTLQLFLIYYIFCAWSFVVFFFFFFLIEVCRQYRNTKPGLVSQCVGASTRPVRQTWQLSFIFHPELISYSSHAGHSGNGSFPPQPLLHDSYFLNFSCNVFYKPQPPSGMY